ncbi:MAG: RHS repeat-associated core domain-containing protein [Lentisphaerae bacterium]|nr:RHS repeat-associated core domain-containing protein [Lentisphaerota bacterium]
MDFDRMGRRVWYKSATDGQTKEYAKFVYDGYLCIQQLDGTTGTVEQEFVWETTETIATRPLKWHLPSQDRTFHYFHDGQQKSAKLKRQRSATAILRPTQRVGARSRLRQHSANITKNVSDVVDASDGSLAAHYEYAPFGAVTDATGTLAAINPYRFSSEWHDDQLGCVYYNYRHYNPLDGRWTSRDPIGEEDSDNLFIHTHNCPVYEFDYIGLNCVDYGSPYIADTIVKAVGQQSRLKWTYFGSELITEEVYPIIIPPVGGVVISRQYCRCTCNVTIERYAVGIKCERMEQLKHCEAQGPCGTIRWTAREDLGWTGGVTMEFVGGGYSGQKVVSAPFFTDQTGVPNCFSSCALACSNHNQPLPSSVPGFTSCDRLASQVGR